MPRCWTALYPHRDGGHGRETAGSLLSMNHHGQFSLTVRSASLYGTRDVFALCRRDALPWRSCRGAAVGVVPRDVGSMSSSARRSRRSRCGADDPGQSCSRHPCSGRSCRVGHARVGHVRIGDAQVGDARAGHTEGRAGTTGHAGPTSHPRRAAGPRVLLVRRPRSSPGSWGLPVPCRPSWAAGRAVSRGSRRQPAPRPSSLSGGPSPCAESNGTLPARKDPAWSSAGPWPAPPPCGSPTAR